MNDLLSHKELQAVALDMLSRCSVNKSAVYSKAVTGL